MTLRIGGSEAVGLYVGAAAAKLFIGPDQVWPPATTETYFPEALPGADGSETGAGITLGVKLTATRTGRIMAGVRWYAPAAMTGTPYLFDGSGAVLATGPDVACSAGWNRMPFSAPYTLPNGGLVIAGVFQAATQKYTAQAGAFGAEVDGDGIIVPTNGGRFHYNTTPQLAETDGSTAADFGVRAILTA